MFIIHRESARRFRDECLNEHWFLSMQHARCVIEAWRIEYNTERPHSSLDDLTPEEFRDAHASEDEAFGSVSVKAKNPVSLTPPPNALPAGRVQIKQQSQRLLRL
jgi:allophanate hydrolase subunit 2